MNFIKKLTDKEVLGTDGLATALPRYTSRAILKNRQGLYAVMYSKKFNLYSLPGGGVENEESFLDALHWEMLEETGCTCDQVEELGFIEENRFHAEYTQVSCYYVVTTFGPSQMPELTVTEEDNGTFLQWYPLEKVIELIKKPVHTTNQRRFLQARDAAALDYYMEDIL